MSSCHSHVQFNNRSVWTCASAVVVIGGIVYWLTAFRTITWWDNSEYTAAAITFGIPHPPGSLLSTMLGWLAVKLSPIASRVYSLNLFAGFLAALTSATVAAAALRLRARNAHGGYSDEESGLSYSVGAAVLTGVLALSFGETLWSHAIKFTPYVLSALFTALIVGAMLRWWEAACHRDALGWLFVVGLLFGLDFSVHRTNSLLLPAALVWVWLARPRLLELSRFWMSTAGGLLAGLCVHIAIIPIAAAHPAMNIGNPDNLSRFWEYVTVKQYGGGFLLDLYPRKGPFFSSQVMDYIRIFGANFFSARGWASVLGVLPTVLGILGIVAIWRRNARLAVALLVLFACSSLGAIIYFNVPAGFFRLMDRHYLPSLVIFAIWIAYGAGTLMSTAHKIAGLPGKIATALAAILILAVPFHQIMRNYRALDSSRITYTHDYAANVLNGLPQDAILFTSGDNDTFPLWCLQQAEGLRPDVTVVNTYLLSTSWFPRLLVAQSGLSFGLTDNQLDQVRPRRMSDTTITFPVFGTPQTLGLSDPTEVPESLSVKITPDPNVGALLPHTELLLRLIAVNQWRRPICFTAGTDQFAAPGLSQYTRFEGYTSRLLPVMPAQTDVAVLRENLFTRYVYRGYADVSIPLDDVTRSMTWTLYYAGLTLASERMSVGDKSGCREITSKLTGLLPPERLHPPDHVRQGLQFVCGRPSESGTER